jgi:hypothetical protein
VDKYIYRRYFNNYEGSLVFQDIFVVIKSREATNGITYIQSIKDGKVEAINTKDEGFYLKPVNEKTMIKKHKKQIVENLKGL